MAQETNTILDHEGNPFVDELADVQNGKSNFMADIVSMAATALERGDEEEAEQYLRQGLEREPNHHQCLAYLSICVATRIRQNTKAEQLAKTLITENPKDATAHYALGMVYLKVDRRRMAFQQFDKAARLAKGDQFLMGRLQAAEPRKKPFFPSLPRDHFMNVLFGKMTAAFKR